MIILHMKKHDGDSIWDGRLQLEKKVLSFRFFFDEFIASNTIFGIRQSVNQIFYGSVTCDKISQSVVSKIRAEDFVFSPGHRIFKDYIISEEYSMEDKSSFIKKLNLSNLPASGADLCDRLEDYYLSNDIYYQLMDESDIYVAMVKLLEHIMYAKDLFPKELKKYSSVTVDSTESSSIQWSSELMQAMSSEGEDFPLDSFKEPLGWYIRLISNHTRFSSDEIAGRTHLARVTFNRKTNPNAKKKRHLYLSDIQEICKAMGTSLGSILYCFGAVSETR